MNKNLQSPTKLTEFGPLETEEKPQGVGQFISKFFKLNRVIPIAEDNTSSTSEAAVKETVSSWVAENSSRGAEMPFAKVESHTNVYQLDVNEGRSLPNVLKRISNLLALKSNNLQDYADTELKQYWISDSVSKECYECCEKFTTFRRKHHCRVCGQIFCSQCCNQQIPGKIFGCTGGLRVCTYCCKVVLSYLQSSEDGPDLTSDLKLLQENLQIKFGTTLSPSASQQDNVASNLSSDSLDVSNIIKRKISVGYQEERFASGGVSNYLTTEEKCRALQNSASLRNLFEEICKSTTGIPLGTHKYRLRTYTDCFLGSELVDWLICQQKANSRVQAAAICQALLEGGYIECVSEPCSFVDGYALYKPGVVISSDVSQMRTSFDVPTQDEPSWVQQIPQESSTTDSDNEQMSPVSKGRGKLASSSSYMLDMNIEASTVYLSRPPVSATSVHSPQESPDSNPQEVAQSSMIRTSEQREFVPESGWHNATNLRDDNAEKLAYTLLTEAYEQHEQSLLRQLLCANGLSLAWVDVILPLAHEIVDVIRPDKNHNAEDLDIRHYVQFKKLSGGSKSDTKLIRGIVCSKNIAHKGMAREIEDPKILLLHCSIVYQRTEGRLMSLEPVLMQEHDHLRHVAARIVALQPDVVLVHRNVSRLAQDLLLAHGITLVHNVKQSVLERLARCTEADLVTALDAHIGRPKLATCKKFYVKSFNTEKGGLKTLMFFEGLPMPHLGGTVLLRGGPKSELSRLEKVASFIVFSAYNWRLEKSFLMDEFAMPLNLKCEFLDDSKESSPTLPTTKIIVQDKTEAVKSKNSYIEDLQDDEVFRKEIGKTTATNTKTSNKKEEDKCETPEQTSEGRKVLTETVNDFTDPLHSYKGDEDSHKMEVKEKFSVAELPFSNSFRKALDDAILCISPYLVFNIPYLETEIGKKCKIRKFFPAQIYYSKQFDDNNKVKPLKDVDESNKDDSKFFFGDSSLHPFLTSKLTSSIENSEVQGLLAHFRACGGRFKKKETLDIVTRENDEVEEIRKKLKNERDIDKQDVLDPHNHQRLAVLFCSYSHESVNAPAFCVNPWVVYMDFYVRNDIPLGFFLEKYCFRSTYECPSKTCDTPMLRHVRRFVHNAGCVSIMLNNFENEFPEEGIVMWTWCSKCQSVSPVVPMSADTWSFSFAKYLELKFHGGVYTRRGVTHCNHSLHHDHYQYFGYKKYVASFSYTSVQIWEISLPPSLIEVHFKLDKTQNELIDDIRLMSQRGHEIYSLILEKLACLPAELEGLGNLKQLLLKEQSQFKLKIEEIQLKLTSPTIESKDFQDAGPYQEYWKITDALVRIKRMIVETVDSWKVRLAEGARKRDTDRKKDKAQLNENDSASSTDNKLSASETSVDDISDAQEAVVSSMAPFTKKIRSLDQEEDKPNRHLSVESYEDITGTSGSPVIASAPATTQETLTYTIDPPGDSDTACTTNTNPNILSTSLADFRRPQTHPQHQVDIESSPKCHQRSQSDGTTMTQNDEVFDSKKETDKKTMKNILQQLLPSNPVLTSIPSPFNLQEHYTLPTGVMLPIIVYENEPSSIVAYALNSFDYKKSYEEINCKKCQSAQQTPSPINKRKSGDKLGFDVDETTKQPLIRNRELKDDTVGAALTELSQTCDHVPNLDKTDDAKKQKSLYIEVQFEDANCNFFCRIYFAEKFAALRSLVLPIGEEGYIRSLTRSVPWNARGGKSGSNFAKTIDDRFILKEMSKSELQLFLEFAQNYFLYMHRCYTTGQPTLLGKIVGIYQVTFKNNNTSGQLRTNLLVMENLFYNRTVSQKFDLKGSMRNRLVIPDNQEGEIVLLDENLLKMSCDSPLYILPHSKAVLTAAIQNDTEFLSAQSVMDYSLLVGLDTENKELVLGIIDYIRRFTWDKKIETMVKKSGLLGGQGKLPTIISPEEYQKRFIEAMHRYFLEVPDHWAGLGKGLEF